MTEPVDPSRLRVSDAERHAVAEVLRQAAGEGRLDLDELDERLERTYAARTYADLVPLTVDLPDLPEDTPAPRVTPPAVRSTGQVTPRATHDGSFALMSETRRSGVWQVGPSHWALALMGSVVIDLRRATFTGRELVVTANALMGSVEIYVNPRTHVVVDGVGVMGSFTEGRSKQAPEAGPDDPVVRVRGVALMGSVDVRRRNAR